MDSFNNLESNFKTEIDRLQARLLKQLESGEKTENLTSAPEWEFYVSSILKTIDDNKKLMATDKFVNDHNGYLFVAAQTMTLQRLIDNIDTIKSAFVRAAKRLNELEESSNEA